MPKPSAHWRGSHGKRARDHGLVCIQYEVTSQCLKQCVNTRFKQNDPIDEGIIGQQGSGMWPREPGHSSAWMRPSDGRNHAGVPQHIAKRI